MSPSPSTPTRRRFLHGAAALATAPVFAPNLLRSASPNGKLQLAAVGTSNKGWSTLRDIASHPECEVVALCDVDTSRMERAIKAYPDARRYQDYRELLATEGDNIDAVSVGIPDHMHAPVSLAAMAEGKHVYCEKPLTHNVAEARAVRLAAEEAGVVTQMGNQIQSFSEYRTAVRWVREGVIGKIKSIHAWCGGGRPQAPRPTAADPIPESLDWDLWLGVAPARPFNTKIYHPFQWRGWRDFGGGTLGDIGCHILDTPFKSTGISIPTRVRANVDPSWPEDEGRFVENFPNAETVEWDFPGTEWTADETLRVTWYDGDRKPDKSLASFADNTRSFPNAGALFLGEEGQFLLPHYSQPELLPRTEMAGRDLPREGQGHHYHAFVDACLGRGETGSSFGYAGPLTETVHLGRAAQKHHGQWLDWDAEAMAFPNLPAADQWLRREHRQGW